MNTRCIVVRHNDLHPLSKAELELFNFIKIEVNTLKDKISKILVYLPMQATPGISGGCDQWSTLPVSPAGEVSKL